jgi:hypothetical protein
MSSADGGHDARKKIVDATERSGEILSKLAIDAP